MSTSLHTIDPNDITIELKRAWSQMTHLAERASREAERASDGEASQETKNALTEVNDRITLLEAQVERAQTPAGTLAPRFDMTGELTLNGQTYQYAKQTPEHLRFVRALRVGLAGMPDAQRDSIKLADDDWTQAHKAMSEADGTLGGYAASNEFSADILRLMQNASPIRQVVTVHPIGGTGMMQPVRAGIQTASRVSETGTRVATSGDMTFRLEQVSVHEMMAFTKVSRADLADSHFPLDAELASGAAAAFALLEGTEFITGNGVGCMLGLNNASNIPAANLVTCADSSGHLVATDDIIKLCYKSIAAPYIAGGRLLLHPTLLGTLRALRATSGNTYLAPVMDSPNTFMGIPVTLIPDLATNATPAAGNIVAYFLNPMAYAVVVRQDIVVQRAVEMYAEQGLVGFYIYTRTGGQIVLPEAVARLTTA
jgi:HK97 family phage major capsid protein